MYMYECAKGPLAVKILADGLCELLDWTSGETLVARRAAIKQFCAPATSWEFDILHLTYVAMCANSMVVRETEEIPVICPWCREPHPVEGDLDGH